MKRNKNNDERGMMAFNKWLAEIGRTAMTGYRWRQKGVVKTENIFGRLYISADERERFNQQAEAGKFAQAPHGAVAQKV